MKQNFKVLKIIGESTGKKYFTIIGKETKEDIYRNKGNFTKLLITNANGKVFHPDIEKTGIVNTGYKKWEQITFEELPKHLQKHFKEEWDGRFLNS